MYIISSANKEKHSGQIANTVLQVTAQPESIAVSINKNNYTHELIRNSGFFSVSVLSRNASLKLIGIFGFRSGRDIDKFAGVNLKTGKNGTPIVLDSSIAYLEVEVTNEVDVGTHTIFIGKVIDAEKTSNEEPMTYNFYREMKGGVTPESAPTYSAITKTKEGEKTKYRCTICGYVYDPDKGDPDSGITPGTEFEKLPDSWVCPVCGASKDQFEKIA